MESEPDKLGSSRHVGVKRVPSTLNASSLASSSGPVSQSDSVTQEKGTATKEFEIEFGHGVSEEDKALSRRHRNAVEFAFDYSKLWCKSCKDIVLGLEKRAYAENEAIRSIAKQFQALEASVTAVNGAPMKQQTINLAHMMVEHSKELETHNTKRCRELLEVLTRQRTNFERTRKYLKDKWKTDFKRLVDAENSLFKTKSAYYQRCQTGVKLREELAAAQNMYDECSALVASATASGVSGGQVSSGGVSPSAVVSPTQTVGSSSNLAADGDSCATPEVSSSSTTAGSTSTQLAKQRAKVERLEKQLSDNDKKEIELMYAYREAVDVANSRLYDLEKSKIEILCDTRLTILKSDEVVKDSLAELFNHLYTTRIAMVKQYETLAKEFQEYVPCSDYRALVEEQIQKGVETFPEKYQFSGFHEATASGLKLESTVGRFGRISASSREAGEADPLSGIHSDSESEGEQAADGTTLAATRAPGIVSTSSHVFSSIVEFGSNLFRPDSKKSIRNKRGPPSSQATIPGSATTDALDNLNAQLNQLDKEYTAACIPIARCIAAIEKQPGGLETHGIYRVPASKAKVASLLEILQTSQPSTAGQLADDIAVLSQEHPLTLAGLIKTRLIALPEPLLTYNLYPNFVELGKVFDTADEKVVNELVKRLRLLITHLSPGNRKLAGLLFHHLNRVAACQTENKMSAANLGTMFAPTVLRQKPKFQVANMMEFVDNRGQTRVVEVLIDQVTDIFGPAGDFDPRTLILALANAEEKDKDEGRAVLSTLVKGDSSQKSPSLHPQTVRTQSGALSSGNELRSGSIATIGQPGLLRSATISATSPGRSSALIGNPMPLYTPYQATSSLSTPGSKVLDVQKHDSADTSVGKPAEVPDKDVTLTPQQRPVSTGNAPEPSNSVVKNFKRLVTQPSSGPRKTFGVSSIQMNLTSPFSKQSGGEKSTISSASPLSNLVIGRRRTGAAMTSDPTEPQEEKSPFDRDDYGYIDTDPSDPAAR